MKGLKICICFLASLTIIFNLEGVKCSKPTGTLSVGGVASRRSCVGKLLFYQGEEIVQTIE